MTTDHRLSLPGVSADYLAKAKVDRIEANSAFQFCGIRESGMVFPYFNFHGEAVEDGGIEFARLRLDQPRGDQKYHQRSGSAPHAYLPPSIWGEDKNLNNPILVVEGEKKALALAEEGFTAIALGGFYNFRDGTGELVPEIVEFLHYVQDPFFIFLGDQDVVFNYQFSHAARTFGQLVAPASVLVSCVPLAAPGKGIDDCRHALGTDFKPWMVEHVYSGAVIDSKSTAGSVAWELLRLQVPTLVGMEGVKRDEARRGLSKLAAGLRGFPLEQNNVTETAEKLGVGRNIFKRLVKQENRRSVMENVAEELGGDTSKVIDLGEQPGTWTRDVLEVVGPQTYLFGDNLCDLSGGAFKPHTPASLVPRLDSKDCCRFVRVNSSGEASRTQLSEKETRLVLGALEQHKKFLQPVKTLAQA
ncbi:MAG: putative primase/helicase, partial [Chthoniobacter sp.]|nr:putative primase/helicase [Chthoniobacter sp.]